MCHWRHLYVHRLRHYYLFYSLLPIGTDAHSASHIDSKQKHFTCKRALFVLLLLCILATPKVILLWIVYCGNVHNLLSASWSHIWFGHILIMPSAWLGGDKYTFLSHWFFIDQSWNPWGQKSPMSQHGRRMFYSFGHVVLSTEVHGVSQDVPYLANPFNVVMMPYH